MSSVSSKVIGEGNTKPPRIRALRWCYTLNNYEEEEYVYLSTLFSKEKFHVVGKEVGEQGTPHLQGYVEFKNQKDLTALKKINPKIHWEKAKANRASNVAYCTKEDASQRVKKDWQKIAMERHNEEMIRRSGHDSEWWNGYTEFIGEIHRG